jgi:UDP-N-acetylglucosamine 2-epimerase (non-hydrolysing)
MIDSLHFALPKARQSDIVTRLKLVPKRYVVVTLHRPSNVDDRKQLEGLLRVLVDLGYKRDIVLPLHPRTQKNLIEFGLEQLISGSPSIHLIEPQSYIAFLALLLEADFVLTDSGGVQEETTALGIPCLTLRTTTERPITCIMGTNGLVQPSPELVRNAIWTLLNGPRKEFQVPPLWDGKASDRIVEIILESCL